MFLDALGVSFEYEPETYDLGEFGWYLPDFWLPSIPALDGTPGIYLEVKPSRSPSDREYDRAKALHVATRRPVVIALGFGKPPFDQVDIEAGVYPNSFPGGLYDIFKPLELPSAAAGGSDHHFAICVCGRVEVSFFPFGTECKYRAGVHGWDTGRLLGAYDAALSFRPDGR